MDFQTGKGKPMSEKNRVKIKICGNEFFIVSTDSEEYIRSVAEKVDRFLQNQMKHSASMSTTMAAVFTAMDFCDEAMKATETADNLRAQIKDYLEEAAAAKSEATELRRREIELERENASLRTKVKKQEKEVKELNDLIEMDDPKKAKTLEKTEAGQ